MGQEATPLTPDEMSRERLPLDHQQYLYALGWLPSGSRLNRGLWDALVDAWDTKTLPRQLPCWATLRGRILPIPGQLDYSGMLPTG